jgi:hypothetical protein
MNYTNLYVNLLIKHGTEAKPKGYSERHHILPLSLGGTDAPDNLIYLSARAHYIAHWLLFKMTKTVVMARAFYGMCDTGRRPERKRVITSRRYASAKKAFGEFNHMKLASHRIRASESAREQWASRYDEMKESNTAMFSDPLHPMYMKGKVGDAHPRSRAVITPLGRFGSVREAGKAHGIAHPVISRYCKSESHSDYFYEDSASK